MAERKVYKDALDAINKLYSDQSVSRSETREDLKGLREEIDLLIETLRKD